MSRLHLPPGLSLGDGDRRLNGARLWPPRMLGDGASTATSNRATTIATANAISHTVGAWVEVVAALSADVGWVLVVPVGDNSLAGLDTSALLNVGVGAAASEVTVIPSLGVGWGLSVTGRPHPGWLFPLFIAKGSRVAIQNQAAVTLQANGARLSFFAFDQIAKPSDKILAMGVSLAASKGVTLATPGAINTEGAWTEIIAATTEPLVGLGLSVQGGADATQSGANFLVDVAIGSAGNEVSIISDVNLTITTAEAISFGSPLVHAATIPQGSRLSARMQYSATGGAIDVALYGIRAVAS